MPSAAEYRSRAAACRRAADLSRRPTPYLLTLAEHYDQQAARLDAQFAGDKPGASEARDTAKSG